METKCSSTTSILAINSTRNRAPTDGWSSCNRAMMEFMAACGGARPERKQSMAGITDFSPRNTRLEIVSSAEWRVTGKGETGRAEWGNGAKRVTRHSALDTSPRPPLAPGWADSHQHE